MGTVEFHLVKEGETMQLISQKEAMSLDNLYQFNNLKRDDMPLVGEQLSLQYRSYGTPKLVEKAIAKETVIVEPEAKPAVVITETAKAVEPQAETTSKGDIKDLEKAKKVESILTGKPESKSEIQITELAVASPPVTEVKKQEVATPKAEVKMQEVATAKSEVKKEAAPPQTADTPKTVELKKEEPAPVTKVEPKPKPVAPKRNYNEKGVSDSVKILKERFDNLVYRPFERRAKPTPPAAIPQKVEVQKVVTPNAIVTKNASGITKEPTKKTETKTVQSPKDSVVKKATSVKEVPLKKPIAKKDSVSKKPTAKVDTAKAKVIAPAEPKSTNVEKTKNGIVRDVKKMEEDRKKAKEAELKAKEAADAKKNAAKVVKKKAATKK